MAVPTYYPSSPSIEGAEPVVLRPGEVREGMDIRMARSPSFCIDGMVEAGGGPAPFEIRETSPANAASAPLDSGPPLVIEPGKTVQMKLEPTSLE